MDLNLHRYSRSFFSAEKADACSVLIEPSQCRVSLRLQDIWQYRELLYFLIWRDVKVRYKQTALGLIWIVLQPIISIVIFSTLFGSLLKVPSGEFPYPVFAYCALLPWNYFAGAVNRSSMSLVGSANLITKVYFPRLVIPISAVLSGLVDFSAAFAVLVLMMIHYGIVPSIHVVFLPGFLALGVLTAMGVSLWLSALNVRYRDVTHLTPFIVQVWMYVTPVIYGSTLVPQPLRFLLALNPMTGVVEGFRWALLGGSWSDMQTTGGLLLISAAVTTLVLVAGLVFFRATERVFADII